MKEWIISGALVLFGALAMGLIMRSCDDDSAIERKLKESERQIAEAETAIDSLNQALIVRGDSLQHAIARAEMADARRVSAGRQASAALASLEQLREDYESVLSALPDDGLAVHADSVFRIFAARHGSPF